MKINEIMTRNVTCVSPQTSVAQVATMMKDLNIGSLPVCNESGIIGIVTDRDIVVRNVAENRNPNDVSVDSIMTYNVATATPEMQAEDVARLMAKNKIRRIPVVENNKIVGVVSLGDLAADIRFDMEASEALTEISIPGIK